MPKLSKTELERRKKNQRITNAIFAVDGLKTNPSTGLPLFYEVNSKNPMIPKGVWEIKNIQDDGGYNFEFKTWLEVQAEGCTCT